MILSFEWDDRKNRANQRKHGISFEEAQSIFFDENALEFPDPDHSDREDRFLLLGRNMRLRILVACHCLIKNDRVLRIISARKATARERGVYDRRGRP